MVFLFCKPSRQAPEPTQPPTRRIPAALCPEVKRTGQDICLHASMFLRSIVLNHKDNRTCKSLTLQWSKHMYIRVMANRTVTAIHKRHQWVGLGINASTQFSSSAAVRSGPSFPESQASVPLWIRLYCFLNRFVFFSFYGTGISTKCRTPNLKDHYASLWNVIPNPSGLGNNASS